jgi:hypothetical protein
MKYRFADIWAHVLMAVGLALMVGALALGILLITFGQRGFLGLSPVEDIVVRVTAALVIVLAGFLAGGPVLVAGQLLRMFVDQRRLLAKINRRLSRWDSGVAPPAAEEDQDRPRFGERFGRR